MRSTEERTELQFDVVHRRAEAKSELAALGAVKSPRTSWSLRAKLPLILGVIAMSVIGLVTYAALNHKTPVKTTTPAPVLTVSTQRPSLEQIEQQILVNGSISAWDPVSVGTESNGLEVKSILVEEGMSVKKGQVLATLDASLLEPQLEAEQARLKASLASAKKAIQPNRPEDINGLKAAASEAQANLDDQQAALAQAQANFLNANQNVGRYVDLQKEGAVSLQELESRQTTAVVQDATVRSATQKVNAAAFSLKQAQEKLKMAQIGGRTEDVQIADANIEEIRGNIKRYQAQIAQTIVRAPVDGIITKRDAHIGDISTAGKSMFSMARESRMELRAKVPESDLANVKPGQTVFITTALSGVAKIKGQVREISPAVDSDTRLATIRIDIPTSIAIKTGMYAQGHIELGKSAALTVPAQAVISSDDKAIVFVLRSNNQIESRPVVVGTRTDDLAEIKSGLRAGESIVVDGAGFLKDGDYVAISK